jgi:hypothetical protein
MSGTPHEPADMLLLRQRKQAERAPGAVDFSRPAEAAEFTRPVQTPDATPSDALASEDDAFVDDVLIEEAPRLPEARAALVLYRPLSQVSLAALHWSATVDHEALQTAIVCCPAGSQPAKGPFEQSLVAVLPLVLPAKPEGVPTLHVMLAADDIAAVEHAMRRSPRPAGLRLVRAAALPTGIAGAELASAGVASTALSAYRTAALLHAWNAVLGAPPAPDIERDRDAAAVNLLSTLRGLLGET